MVVGKHKRVTEVVREGEMERGWRFGECEMSATGT